MSLFRSLRWRVQKGHLYAIFTLLPMFGYLTCELLQEQKIHDFDRNLAAWAAQSSIGQSNIGDMTPPSNLPDGVWFIVCDNHNKPFKQSENAPQLRSYPDSNISHQYYWDNDQRVLAIRRSSDSPVLFLGADKKQVYGGYR